MSRLEDKIEKAKQHLRELEPHVDNYMKTGARDEYIRTVNRLIGYYEELGY